MIVGKKSYAINNLFQKISVELGVSVEATLKDC